VDGHVAAAPAKNDMLEALKKLQSRSEQIFGKKPG